MRKLRIQIQCIALGILLTFPSFLTVQAQEKNTTLFRYKNESLQDYVIRLYMKTMTMDEKIGQMFMVMPEQITGVGQVIAAGETTKEALETYRVGGLIYFADNLLEPDQVTAMITNTKAIAKDIDLPPLFIAVDEEGGSVSRFGNNDAFELGNVGSMQAIGNTGDTDNAYEVGKRIGAFLNKYGFNMDSAPVADVLSNPANKVIGNRSFGEDPNLVSSMAIEELRGLKEEGVTGIMKHFPGHGSTKGDTHAGYAFSDLTLEEMKDGDLIPFQKGIEAGAKVIMVAHIACPNVTGDETPASLSSLMVEDLLRNDMGFEGVIMTDSLQMGAITKQYSSSESSIQAILAGNDVILMPMDFKEAYEGVKEAVSNGTISQERIDASVERILKLKMEMQ